MIACHSLNFVYVWVCLRLGFVYVWVCLRQGLFTSGLTILQSTERECKRILEKEFERSLSQIDSERQQEVDALLIRVADLELALAKVPKLAN